MPYFGPMSVNPVTNPQSRPLEKWKAASLPGWQPLPVVLLRNQTGLGLSATDMLVLVNVLSYWWYADQKPFVRVTTIAKRMGVDVRTVQRSIRKLVEKGLLERRKESRGSNGDEREILDPEGLVQVLGLLAEDDFDYPSARQRETSADGLARTAP
jgi:predicted DNA-binding transcriptional regulator